MYRVDLRARAEKENDTLAPALKRRVLEAIAALAVDPRPVGVQKLAANGGYRVRVGDYRIVFEIDDERQCATVVRVRHRRDVYR